MRRHSAECAARYPMVPAEGLDWFEQRGAPEHVLLTNRHHDRHAWRLCEAYLRLLDLDFELLLLAHGDPALSGANDTLRAFASDRDAPFG